MKMLKCKLQKIYIYIYIKWRDQNEKPPKLQGYENMKN
jgi:hypothetical protein